MSTPWVPVEDSSIMDKAVGVEDRTRVKATPAGGPPASHSWQCIMDEDRKYLSTYPGKNPKLLADSTPAACAFYLFVGIRMEKPCIHSERDFCSQIAYNERVLKDCHA